MREGFLADLLLVDGDPVADVSVLQHKDRLVAILKGGDVLQAGSRYPGASGGAGSGVGIPGAASCYGATALLGIAVLCISIDVAGAVVTMPPFAMKLGSTCGAASTTAP